MRFIKSSGMTLAFKLISITCGLGISILIGRVLGPDGRGVYGLALTIIVLSTNFGLFGLAGANAFLVGGDKGRSRAVGVQSLLTGFVGAAIAASAILLIDYFNPSLFTGLDKNLLIATLALIPLFLWGTLFSYAYLGQGRIAAFNLFESIDKLLILLVGVICLMIFHTDLQTLLVCIAITMAALVAVYVLLYFRQSPVGQIGDLTLLWPAICYGIRSYVATVITYAVMRSGIFFVNYYLGASEAGLFSTAQQISELLVIVPSVIGTVLFSRITRGEGSALTAKTVRTAAVVLLPVFGAMALARDLIFVTLFGPEFAASSTVFLIFLPGAYLLGLEVIMAADIAGRGYPWPAALAWIPILILNVIGYHVLIPHYGINGAALSTTFSFFVLSAFILVYYRRMTGISLRDILIIKREDIQILSRSIRSLLPERQATIDERHDDAKAVSDKGPVEITRVG
jgi:O-antigen/teichoic acid export membrane protein